MYLLTSDLSSFIARNCNILMSHEINFMDDGFSAGKNGASERIVFFLKKMLISPKNGASEEATFFSKKWFPAKIRRVKKQILFSNKET